MPVNWQTEPCFEMALDVEDTLRFKGYSSMKDVPQYGLYY